MIREIREIRVQLNIRECLFFEHESPESPESFNMQTESKEKSVLNPSCPAKAQSKSKRKSKREKSKSESVKKTPLHPCNPWAFFDLSSVAAGLQSALLQYYLPKILLEDNIAAWRSVSLRLQSLNQKNAHGLHWCTRSLLHGFVFWFFSFWFSFDCTLQDKRDFRRILQVRGHLLCLGQ